MSEKYRNRKNSYRRYSRHNVPEPQSKLANQLSAAIIFCIFIFAVSLINTESTQKVRLYTASLISRSIPDEVQFTDSMTDNIKMLVKTALSSNKKDSESITVSEPVISNIEFDKNDNRLSADEETVPVR